MQNLTTKLYKLDYGFIYKNYLNKSLWGKKWVLFEYEDNKIIAYLKCINIAENEIEIGVDVQCSYYWNPTETISLPLAEEHRNYEVFEMKTKKAVIRQIERMEAAYIRDLEVYKVADETKDAERERLEEIAEEFLDHHGIENDDIREAYIETYVDANLTDYTQNILWEYKNKIIPGAYLLYASYIGDEELYEEYREMLEEKISEEELENAVEDAEDRLQYIQTEYFEEEMQEKLEDI